MDARTPPLLLTPPRAAQAPPNTDTPVGRPRRHATLNLGLFGGAEALPEGRGGTNLLAPGVNTPSLALAATPRRAVQTYQAPERPDIAELRPSAAALAQVSPPIFFYRANSSRVTVQRDCPPIFVYRAKLKPRYRTPGLGSPGISAAPRDGPGRSRAR